MSKPTTLNTAHVLLRRGPWQLAPNPYAKSALLPLARHAGHRPPLPRARSTTLLAKLLPRATAPKLSQHHVRPQYLVLWCRNRRCPPSTGEQTLKNHEDGDVPISCVPPNCGPGMTHHPRISYSVAYSVAAGRHPSYCSPAGGDEGGGGIGLSQPHVKPLPSVVSTIFLSLRRRGRGS